MLLSAVCTVLTAIQSFPLEEWQAAFVDEYVERPRKAATADVSSKLGWNLHVQPFGDKVRHKPKRVKNFDGDSFTLERWYNKAATSGKPPSHGGATWKALLSEADRFVDALNKQVKPTNSTGTEAPKVRRLKIDATSEFAKNNGTINPSVSASSLESRPTSTAKPSCEKETYQPTARRVSRFHTSGDPTMLQNGTGHAASSTAPEHIKPKPADQPTLGEGVTELFTSPSPLSQSETYGTKTIPRKSSVWTTERTRTSTNPAVTIPKKRRRFRVKPRTTKPPTQPQPFDRLKSAVVGTDNTNTRLLDRVNNANNDSSLTPQAASNSSRPKVPRRRKKRPKLNLFKPRSRQPTAVQNWTSSSSKCRTAEVWRLSGRCGNATVSVKRPAQRQRQEDHMTQSSVVRPRVYRLDPGAGNEQRKSQFSRPATTSNRRFHRPSAYPASHESHEDYYDYSPEYHDDYYSGASLEDLSDEVTHETDHDERDAVRTDMSSERQSPTLDANTTREEAMGNAEAQKLIGETVGFNATSAIDKTGVEGPVASSVTLRDTEEGFKLLVHDNSELPSIEPAQSTANSTAAEEMPDRSPRETQPPPTDPTSEAASELTAVSPAVHVMPAADSVREVHEASSSHQDKGAGISSGFFSFAEVPAPGHHRFGYRKGNDQHFTGRLELADGPHVKSVVVWADRKGGYGKHIWDYNHDDHKH